MLGRHWETATVAERDDFGNVFRDYMIRVYSDNFANYNNDTFRVIDERAVSDTMTVVRTSITTVATAQAITIEWLVSKKPEGFKVNDLSVDGVSLATAQQEEFASVLQRSGGQVAILTKLMRSKLTQMETAAQ